MTGPIPPGQPGEPVGLADAVPDQLLVVSGRGTASGLRSLSPARRAAVRKVGEASRRRRPDLVTRGWRSVRSPRVRSPRARGADAALVLDRSFRHRLPSLAAPPSGAPSPPPSPARGEGPDRPRGGRAGGPSGGVGAKPPHRRKSEGGWVGQSRAACSSVMGVWGACAPHRRRALALEGLSPRERRTPSPSPPPSPARGEGAGRRLSSLRLPRVMLARVSRQTGPGRAPDGAAAAVNEAPWPSIDV